MRDKVMEMVNNDIDTAMGDISWIEFVVLMS